MRLKAHVPRSKHTRLDTLLPEPPSLPDLLNYLMEQHGLSRADLVPLLGTPSRVSEVLRGKRDLSMSMVRKLRDRFQISADLLISPVRRRGLAA
jgi:antitoxin component HigA of HigAB toxin-antitoxin module